MLNLSTQAPLVDSWPPSTSRAGSPAKPRLFVTAADAAGALEPASAALAVLGALALLVFAGAFIACATLASGAPLGAASLELTACGVNDFERPNQTPSVAPIATTNINALISMRPC